MKGMHKAVIVVLGAFALAPLTYAQQVASGDSAGQSDAQERLVHMAQQTVQQLTEKNAAAKALWDKAYGYAVFDTTKGGLIVTGIGGTGVALPKSGSMDQAVFMHVGGAGIGLSAGLSNYKLILIIEDQQTFDKFVHGTWNASASASAAAGESGTSSESRFVDGVRAFRVTDGGLMATADVSAMKFWPSEELNTISKG
jgi:lipid-binding SYLF domain-containing protein